MKKLLLIGVAALGLSGCIAVPVYDAPPAYGYYPAVPAASVTFGYYGDRRYNRHPRHRHY